MENIPTLLMNIGGINVPISIIMFILGFFTSRFTMTKKERSDVMQSKFENAKNLSESMNSAFQEFSKALGVYVSKPAGKVSFDDFFEISTKGEKYFSVQKTAADAILSGNLDVTSRENFVQHMAECTAKTLPSYYSNLKIIAKKTGVDFNGELQRKNYESIYLVVEKYARLH